MRAGSIRSIGWSIPEIVNGGPSGPVESSVSPKQAQRIDPQRFGDSLKRSQSEIPLASFNASCIGAVDAKNVGERLLGQSTVLTKCPEVAPNGLLEVSLGHLMTVTQLLLDGLHTYK
jgi:hypothetical protein